MNFDNIETNKNILILIDSHERYGFFERFNSAFEELNITPVLITSLPSIYFKSIKSKKITYLCKKQLLGSNNLEKKSFENCLEYAAGIISDKLCHKIYYTTYYTAMQIFHELKIDTCLIWNGARTQSRALSDACREANIPTIFMEISNIPGKLFVDPCGVNSDSFLYKNKNTLRNTRKDEEEYEKWKIVYLENKIKNHVVNQAKKVKTIKHQYIIDFILWHIGFCQRLFGFNYVIKSLTAKFKLKKIRVKATKKIKDPFIFFPLQVNTDSQILFHSDIDNISALKCALKIGASEKSHLVVKVHPAETDPDFIKKIQDLQLQYNFYLTNENTLKLINECKKVVTINSSVGLESIILNKAVIFLGKSIYKNINSSNISHYINSHLVNIDYFDEKKIETVALINMLTYKN